MLKKVMSFSLLFLLAACGNEVNSIAPQEVSQTVDSFKAPAKNSLGTGDISQEVASKVAIAMDLNGDKKIDGKEVHLSINNVRNYDGLAQKELEPIGTDKVVEALMNAGAVLVSYRGTVNEKLLNNLAQAFNTDSINDGKKIKAYSTSIPYLAIVKPKTTVAKLSSDQLAKKFNDGLLGNGFIEILGSSKLIAGKEKSRIRFSIHEDFDKKLPLFSSNTYSAAEIK